MTTAIRQMYPLPHVADSTNEPSPAVSATIINRDLSLLEFFRRVLDEARNESLPILERLKFLAIFASNLDEFFMIRVAGLKEQLETGTSGLSQDGMSVQEQLAEIRRRLLKGELSPNVAAVAVQSINTDIRAMGATLKAREQEELVERLESLEEALEQRKGEHHYGA